MKKLLMLVLVVMLVGSFCCFCSSESKEEVQQVNKENPMFIDMGESIEESPLDMEGTKVDNNTFGWLSLIGFFGCFFFIIAIIMLEMV